MIYFIEGLPGSGKSYELVRLTLDYISQGRDVATTQNLDIQRLHSLVKRKVQKIGRIYKIRELSDIENFTQGVVMIDEAASRIHARKWYSLSEEMASKFSQHRHDSLDMWLASQEFDTVDPVVRGLVGYCYRAEKKSIFGFEWYELLSFIPANRKINRNEEFSHSTKRFDKKLFACYNYKEYARSMNHSMQLMEAFIAERQITFE